MSRRPRNSDASLRGWALPKSAEGDPIEELRAILAPFTGPMEREDLEESAGNVLAVESVLQRWKARRLDAIASGAPPVCNASPEKAR